jgi:hypothetical protein
VFVPESYLQRIETPARSDALDGERLAAIRLYSEHGTRFHGFAIEHDGARTAGGRFATNMGSGKADDLPQIVNQEKARLDFVLVWFSIDSERDFSLHQKQSN